MFNWPDEPIFRLWFLANPSSTNAPFAPRPERTDCEPCFQSRLITFPIDASTAVRIRVLPKTEVSPARTLAIDSTPGACAAA